MLNTFNIFITHKLLYMLIAGFVKITKLCARLWIVIHESETSDKNGNFFLGRQNQCDSQHSSNVQYSVASLVSSGCIIIS
jgi:hypothetical protein